MAGAVLTQHIEVTPGVVGGKPRIAGTRIRVQDIVAMHVYQGQSVASIVAQFPPITRAEVHAALAFYYENTAAIEAALERSMHAEDDFRARSPHLVRD